MLSYSPAGHDKEKVSYCEDCLKVKILSPLRHRIYLDENGKITNPGLTLISGGSAGHVAL